MGRIGIQEARRRIWKSGNPAKIAREVLHEEYHRGLGVLEGRASESAEFELLRSSLVQSVYEINCIQSSAPDWLGTSMIEQERVDAVRACQHALSNGTGSLCDSKSETASGARRSRMMEAMDGRRFLGSYRIRVPGLGYAISVRKRDTENQDSFAMNGGRDSGHLTLADGCSSTPLAAIASHIAAKELSYGELSRGRICAISAMVADALFDREDQRFAPSYGYGGSSTLLAARLGGGRGTLLRVGDSIAYRMPGTGESLEAMAKSAELIHVIGQPDLRLENVEDFEWEGGRIILTSDGITNYLDDACREIGRLAAICRDSVILAENIIRSVLRYQMIVGHGDDATIVVQDI